MTKENAIVDLKKMLVLLDWAESNEDSESIDGLQTAIHQKEEAMAFRILLEREKFNVDELTKELFETGWRPWKQE